MLKACPHRCDNDGSSIFGLSLELLKAAAWGTGDVYVPGAANPIFRGHRCVVRERVKAKKVKASLAMPRQFLCSRYS